MASAPDTFAQAQPRPGGAVTETRGWSAVLLTGTAPKLIVEGEVRTHPYAFATLNERRIVGGPGDTVVLDLRVMGDHPALDVFSWKRVTYERPLKEADCQSVVIGGTGIALRVPVRRLTAHAYARRRSAQPA